MTTQIIHAPVSAISQKITLQAQQPVQLAFDTNDVTVERVDNSLTIDFKDGGQLVLDDFFVTSGGDLPSLVLVNGKSITAVDLLASMNPNMDLTTAAGPSQNSDSSGAGEYADGAGDLIGGVDALGSLGSTQWGTGASFRTAALSVGVVDGPGTPGTNQEVPETGAGHIFSRAVLHRTFNKDFNTVKFRVIDEEGQTATSDSDFTYSFGTPSHANYFDSLINEGGGVFSFTLSQAGQAAVENGTLASSLKIQVGDQGKEYWMEIVVNTETSFNSAKQDQATNDDVSLQGYEWHTQLDEVTKAPWGGDAKNIIGAKDAVNEAWFGAETGSNRIVGFTGKFEAGDKDDFLNFSSIDIALRDAHINLGSGNAGNRVNVTGGRYGLMNSFIEGTAGNHDTVHIKPGQTASGVGSSAFSGIYAEDANAGISGVDNLRIDYTGPSKNYAGLFAANGIISLENNHTISIKGNGSALRAPGTIEISDTRGDITLEGKTNADEAFFSGVINASGGKNTITNTAGKIKITNSGTHPSGIIAEDEGVNTITNENFGHDLDLEITAYDGIYGFALDSHGGGKNKIFGSGLGDTVTIIGDIQSSSSSENIIKLGDGKDILNVTGSITSGFGTNIIDLGEGVEDSLTLKGNFSSTGNTGSNTVRNVDELTINANRWLGGISARDGGLNALGDHTENDYISTVIVDMHKTSAKNNYDMAGYAMTASDGGSNFLYGDKIKFFSAMETSVTNSSKFFSSLNEVEVRKSMKISIDSRLTDDEYDQSYSRSYAMGAVSLDASGYTSKGNILENSIKAVGDDVDISLAVEDGYGWTAYGMYARAKGDGSKIDSARNTISGDGASIKVEITVTGEASQQFYAMFADGAQAQNDISLTGNDGRVNITGDIFADGGGQNDISLTGNNGRVSIAGDIFADGGGQNDISLTGNNGRVSITGDISANGGGQNDISLTGNNGRVSITGDVFAKGEGQNNITMGDGIDHLFIDGKVLSDGSGINSFNTGKGNDFVHLQGGVGALTLEMGKGDYDTLVLYATSVDEFMDKYGLWLKNTTFAAGNIEAVHITMGTEDFFNTSFAGTGDLPAYQNFHDYLKATFPDNDISFSVKQGDSIVHNTENVTNFEYDGSYLSNLISIEEGKEIIIQGSQGKSAPKSYFDEQTIAETLDASYVIEGSEGITSPVEHGHDGGANSSLADTQALAGGAEFEFFLTAMANS